jgi:hypothetical protein
MRLHLVQGAVHVRGRPTDETFEDDLGSRIRIQAERTPDGLRVRLDGRCADPVTIVVRDVPAIRSVTDGASRKLRRVEAPHVLQPGGCAVLGGDLYIKTDECAGERIIQY